jgi:hypothetical protein
MKQCLAKLRVEQSSADGADTTLILRNIGKLNNDPHHYREERGKRRIC